MHKRLKVSLAILLIIATIGGVILFLNAQSGVKYSCDILTYDTDTAFLEVDCVQKSSYCKYIDISKYEEEFNQGKEHFDFHADALLIKSKTMNEGIEGGTANQGMIYTYNVCFPQEATRLRIELVDASGDIKQSGDFFPDIN